ncbi:hypothetical protein LPW11_08260 [Geomonas sp. RF6]|uniref:hypothetical protein n=1 Tax=Geomonas sp. RF6 TaxID=2897342 RepID=UPI001E64A69B|nr:hypothetical protein [Geomonas sp. RF6]UFS72173.1 hypothetical protein LPW11_08260 [Geomonas sp. RF6]
MAQRDPDGVLERGNIYFLYRPKVEQKHPKGERDIERFFMVMSPEGKKLYREIIIGRKALPKVHNGGDRNWGFVKMVVRDPHDLVEEFKEARYETKTRGTREVGAARPAGEGVYAIVRHDDHTHLVYSLELPEKPREVQRELGIEDEASYILSIKNPEKPAPQQAGLRGDQKATYPYKLREGFQDRRFIDADPPDFLDYEGTEIMLIGAAEDPSEELGIELDPEKETLSSADIFKDLKLSRKEHPVKPLLEGKWE